MVVIRAAERANALNLMVRSAALMTTIATAYRSLYRDVLKPVIFGTKSQAILPTRAAFVQWAKRFMIRLLEGVVIGLIVHRIVG
jgi:hypothetical protein